ncbi:MAG: N-acetylglucosamine-6-phosphate deacetylase [Clostridia bacterium]|nr:N-acetylglucosamine-6-phosphate deacetylase [Clostridia bacterium]
MLANSYFWIGNGTTVLPGRACKQGSVLVKNGKILAVNEACPQGVTRIDAKGGYILPGFIDLHVHGGGGADFMDATPESVATVAIAHAKHGTTGLLATSMTSTNDVLEKMINSYLIAEEKGTGGAELLGLHLEGPYFSAKNKGAQPVKEQRIPTREELEYFIKLAKGRIVRWDEAPELENTDVFAQVMKENGIIASIAHTSAIAAQAYAAFDMGFSHITHFYSATTTGQKIDGLCYSGVNEATFLDDRITVELIADGRHIPREHMLLTYKIKGADKLALITDAMRAADTNDTQSILGAMDTGVPVVIKDNVAQLPDFSSYAGSVGTMDNALRVAHVRYGIPLVDVVKMMSLTPARIIGRSHDKGSLEVGKDADIVIMNNDFEVESVYVCGVEI